MGTKVKSNVKVYVMLRILCPIAYVVLGERCQYGILFGEVDRYCFQFILFLNEYITIFRVQVKNIDLIGVLVHIVERGLTASLTVDFERVVENPVGLLPL